MNIIALDLGTNTGYTFNYGSEFFCGTWNLGTPKEIREWGKNRLTRRCDPRIERLSKRLKKLYDPDLVIFEDVQFCSTIYACQLWASLRAAVWLSGIPRIECLPVGTLKKYASGNGHATKDQMKIAFDREGIAGDYNDDAIDSYFLWKWAKQHLRIK